MTSIQALKQEILNRMWNISSPDVKRSPEFLKYLEQRIRQDREELLSEILTKVQETDSLYNAIEVIKQFKIK